MRNYILKPLMICAFMSVIFCLSATAQIGYQISLLNTATGEARANETVNVTATITDSSGGVIYTGTQSATSNDFGVLSLSVGDADTFTNLDLQQHRLPFFIEVSANGAMIGKMQILSVPVAEVARKLEPQLKLEDVVGTWYIEGGKEWQRITFNTDMTATCENKYEWGISVLNGNYIIVDGNSIIFYYTIGNDWNISTSYYLINGKMYRHNV